jgi:hypothetical protein
MTTADPPPIKFENARRQISGTGVADGPGSANHRRTFRKALDYHSSGHTNPNARMIRQSGNLRGRKQPEFGLTTATTCMHDGN